MSPDGVFNNDNPDNNRNGSHLWKRLGAFTAVSAALILAAKFSYSKKDTHNYVRTYENETKSIQDQHAISLTQIYTDSLDSIDFDHLVYGPTVPYHPYHPEKVVSIEPVPSDDDYVEVNTHPDHLIFEGGYDEKDLYDPYNPFKNEIDDSMWAPVDPVEEIFMNSTIQGSKDDDGSRLLQEYSDYLYPLPCNEDVAFDCTSTLLSSLPVPSDGPLFIECGSCVRVDISDGGQLELPEGLRIEGMLYFPPEANLTIRSTHVHVLGILKMDLPLPENKVKISLYGEDDLKFVASDRQDPSITTLCQGDGCDVGRKHIAVVGGQLDIQGIEQSCPAWERMLDLSTATTAAPSVSPTRTNAPTLSAENACAGNILVNGDFEADQPWPTPFAGHGKPVYLFDDPLIPGNQAVEMEDRLDWWYGLWTDFTTECFTDTETQWKLAMDVRFLDGATGEALVCDPLTGDITECPVIQFEPRFSDGSSMWYSFMDDEIEWKKDEWSHYSVIFDAFDDLLDASFVRMYIQGGPVGSTYQVDNVSLERFTGDYVPPAPEEQEAILNQIHLSQEAAECWPPGSEIVITSNNNKGSNYQVATIDTTDPASGTLKLTSGIDSVSTIASDPNHAVEVALLNRRIVFEADDSPGDHLIGGHLIFYGTPAVDQHLEGVEIRNFGQQGNLGRYPVHFHICNDGFGSVIKKNVVRQSNQRCFVMHGTSGVWIEENVAFDTFGHCYMTEDGVEHSNHFIRNLGIHTKNSQKLLSQHSGRSETDDRASTFWMTNMENFFEGNVAAGSEMFGYWVEAHYSINGRGASSYQNPTLQPIHTNLGSFKDNVAHSIRDSGFASYPPGWLPEERAIIENFRAYRIDGAGILLHNTKNISFVGGYLGHIRGYGAVWIFGADDTILDGIEFVGEPNENCGKNRGVIIYPMRAQTSRTNKNDNYGVKMRNLTIKNWTSQGGECHEPFVQVDITQVSKPGWDAYSLMENIVVEDDSDPLIASACTYENKYEPDAAIEIVSDSNGIFGGPGMLVGSLNVPLAGTECQDVDGCLFFCPGVCMRTIKFQTSGALDVHGYKMKVSDGIQNITVNRWYSNYDYENPNPNPYLQYLYYENSFYSVSLPAGSFNVWWEEESNPGVIVYPKFVYPFFEEEPSCSDYVTEQSLTILKPPVDEPRCDQLVHNGDFATDIAGWQEYHGGIVFDGSAGVGNTGAILGRYHEHFSMISQWLDMSCFMENPGVYLFEASYRMVDQIDDLDSAIDMEGIGHPDAWLQCDRWNKNEGKLEHTETVLRYPIVYPTDSPSASPTSPTQAPTSELPQLIEVGDEGFPPEVYPLGNCEGECDSDSDCQGTLKCFQRSGLQPVPGCIGLGVPGRDHCYDPNYVANGSPPDSDLKELIILGDDGIPAEVYPLGMCEGECDNHADCQEGLKCFKRIGFEPIPGCSGQGNFGDDYCYDPDWETSVDYHYAGNNNSPVEAFPLGECEGDCDSDSDCEGSLSCFQRDGDEQVPGCRGTPRRSTDYCYQPSHFETTGFHKMEGQFVISPRQAAIGATVNLQFRFMESPVIIDNISLVRASWSSPEDYDPYFTSAPSDAPSEIDDYSAVPSESPQDGATDSPFESPIDSNSESPTVIASESLTVTASAGPTVTASESPTVTASESPTVTASQSPTITASESPTVTASESPTVTASQSPTITASGSPTVTASGSPTITASGSPTVTASQSPTITASGSPTVTASGSPTVTASGSPTVTASQSPTVTASGSPTVTASRSPTVTASQSPTVTASDSPTVTASDSPTVTASDSPTVTASDSPTVIASDSPTVTASEGPSATASEAPTETPVTDAEASSELALAVMTHVVEVMQPIFEASLTLTATSLELILEFDRYTCQVTDYVEATFPGGAVAMDHYDDDLPNGVPSIEEYLTALALALASRLS